MKPIVELISRWAEFESEHPEGDVDSFCRYILAQHAESPVSGGNREMQTGMLTRVIGRLSSAYALYHRAAMNDMGLPGPDSFYYLNSLLQLGEVQKKELINFHFAETTTGMAAIDKLIKAGFVVERDDPDDGRARLIKLTEAGLDKLGKCLPNASKVNEMIFHGVPSDDLKVCYTLLKKSEQEHSTKSILLKNKGFDEMYEAIVGRGRGD